MPPRRQTQRQARSSGNDPTASITAAAAAKSALLTAEDAQEEQEDITLESPKESGTNDDLKKLIETLKNKLNTNSNAQKKTPPSPGSKTAWNRSVVSSNEKTFNPAYTVLTRISNHEKVPVKSTKVTEITSKSLPDSFIFRPGADGIKIDKLDIKAGKQLGIG